MATADELLSTLDTDKTLIIDKDLRTIIIPSSVKNLGVESDDDVLRLKFSMPRMYGDVDLSDFSIYINYMNAKNTGDVYVVDDKTIADDTITFSWLVGRVALAYKGNVRFIVCMKKHDDNSNVIQEYNTTIASLPVLEGLETGETVIQQNPDIIEMLLTLSEPLVGTNKTLTPTQVREAFLQGQPIVFSYIDALGEVAAIFQSFEIYDDIIVASTILPPLIGSQDMGVGLVTGYLSSNVWDLSETLITNPDDIQKAINTALAAAKASGEFDGADGITPTIGNNGNWFLGDTDTGKPSRGDDGKSAYSYAQDGGYTGTEAEFAAKLAAESIDKALFVVNITTTDEVTYSADKTFDEITQAYNEGKYNIVAVWDGLIMPLSEITESVRAIFGCISGNDSFLITITYDNKVREEGMMLATIHEKLPNPYPLTFTGAVNATYDGSSAKTIEIPSGGGGEKEWTVLVDQELSAETPGSFSITGLNNFTEFYAEWDALQHGTNNTTNSGMYFWINDIQVSASPSFCPVYAPSNTPRYGWTMAKYNGLRWLLAKSDGTTSKENTSIASPMITQYYPSDITAPATKVYVGGSGNYAAVSGHFRLWGR